MKRKSNSETYLQVRIYDKQGFLVKNLLVLNRPKCLDYQIRFQLSKGYTLEIVEAYEISIPENTVSLAQVMYLEDVTINRVISVGYGK